MVLQAQRNYFHTIYQLAAEVNSARTPNDILYSLAEITTKGMGAKGCSLMILTSDGKQLIHTSSYGLSDWYVRKGPISADRSIAQALEGQAVAVKNATEDDRIQYREQAKQEGIASIFSVPMMLRETIIGVMRIYTAEPCDFTDDDLYFVCAAANLGAIALENGRMYEDCQKSQEECRHQLLEWRAAMDYEWMFEEQEPSADRYPPELAGA